MIDWALVLLRLQNQYGSIHKLAAEVNSCPVHLRRLARGEINEPKFMVGVKLLDLHYDYYKNDASALAQIGIFQ